MKLIARLVLLTSLLTLCMAFSACAEEFGPGFTGWHQETDGNWRYYTSGTPAAGTWKEIDGKNYYFDAAGNWVENADPNAGTQNDAAQNAQTADAAQAQPSHAADAAALANGAVSPEYADRANPYPQYRDVVEVDIANQHVFCYKGNVLMWDSYCVTGCVKEGHSTPEGVFQIQSKERSRYLTGPVNPATGKPKWKNWVEYWMPFHNGCGLHDASWRNKFAGTIYQYGGSHGCVNLPVAKAPILYDLVYVGMPVVVHP